MAQASGKLLVAISRRGYTMRNTQREVGRNPFTSLPLLIAIFLLVAVQSTGLIPVFVFSFGIAAMLGGGALLFKLRVTPIAGIVVLNYIYWMVSGYFSGALSVGGIFSLKFIAGDGRIFVYYAPLIIFSPFIFDETHLAAVYRLLVVVAGGVLFMAMLWIGGVVFHDRNFEMFFTHHSAAGIFLAGITLFLFIRGQEQNKIIYTLLSALMACAVVLAGSRAAMIGLMLGGLWYLAASGRIGTTVLIAAFGVIMFVGLASFSPWGIERTAELFHPDTIEAIDRAAESDGWDPTVEKAYGGPQWNVYWRVVFWKRGVDLFVQSPLVGVGFGRFNDGNVIFSGVPNVVSMATRGEPILNVIQAHNSVLQFLSEIGIFGLFLILSVWYAIYHKAKAISSTSAPGSISYCYAMAVRASIIVVFSASFFGHTLGAPAIGVFITSMSAFICQFERRAPHAI